MIKLDTNWYFWPKVKISSGCWEWTADKTHDGYGTIMVNRKMIMAHRFAYESMVSIIPIGLQIDHICHNPACVNPGHLRLATNAQNSWNRGKHSNNTSGYKGVSWVKTKNKWMAQISVNKHHYFLGYFDDPALAYLSYCNASLTHHKEFSKVG